MTRTILISLTAMLCFGLVAGAQVASEEGDPSILPLEGEDTSQRPDDFPAPPQGGPQGPQMDPEEMANLPVKIIVYTDYSLKEDAMVALTGILDSKKMNIESSSATKLTAYATGRAGGPGPQGMPQGGISGMSGGMGGPGGGMGGGMGGPGGGMGGGMGGPGGGMGGGMRGGMGGPGGGMGMPGMSGGMSQPVDSRPFLKAKIGKKKGKVVITLQTNKNKKDTFTPKINLNEIAKYFPHATVEVLK